MYRRSGFINIAQLWCQSSDLTKDVEAMQHMRQMKKQMTSGWCEWTTDKSSSIVCATHAFEWESCSSFDQSSYKSSIFHLSRGPSEYSSRMTPDPQYRDSHWLDWPIRKWEQLTPASALSNWKPGWSSQHVWRGTRRRRCTVIEALMAPLQPRPKHTWLSLRSCIYFIKYRLTHDLREDRQAQRMRVCERAVVTKHHLKVLAKFVNPL